MYVKFIASPTGKHNLAYSPGEEAEIDDDLGLLLVTEGFAWRITPPEQSDPPPGDEKPEGGDQGEQSDPPPGDEKPEGGDQGEQSDPPPGDEKPEDRTDKKLKEKR